MNFFPTDRLDLGWQRVPVVRRGRHTARVRDESAVADARKIFSVFTENISRIRLCRRPFVVVRRLLVPSSSHCAWPSIVIIYYYYYYYYFLLLLLRLICILQYENTTNRRFSASFSLSPPFIGSVSCSTHFWLFFFLTVVHLIVRFFSTRPPFVATPPKKCLLRRF